MLIVTVISEELFFYTNRQYDKFKHVTKTIQSIFGFYLRMLNQQKLEQPVCTESATFFSYELTAVRYGVVPFANSLEREVPSAYWCSLQEALTATLRWRVHASGREHNWDFAVSGSGCTKVLGL